MPEIDSDGFNLKQLKESIFALSTTAEWEEACEEWYLERTYKQEYDDPQTCLCGHYPILEICVIRNKVNDATTEVGNVCIKQFMGMRPDLINDGVERIKKSLLNSLNPAAIEFFYARGVLNESAHDFYLETWRLKRLTPKQRYRRIFLNKWILTYREAQERAAKKAA